jgi:hypothetical protein
MEDSLVPILKGHATQAFDDCEFGGIRFRQVDFAPVQTLDVDEQIDETK